MYTRDQALETMNKWGLQQIPFLFVIDFEMQKIRLFRTDNKVPEGIRCMFPGSDSEKSLPNKPDNYLFQKSPIPFPLYKAAYDDVRTQILAGNSFLVNLTFPTSIVTSLSLSDIYEFSNAKYKLLIDNEFVVFSPESFVTIKDGCISSYPMKGTVRASVPGAEESILKDLKETAEHHTIVDLIRNDLSMVANNVSVKRFRYVDRIHTNEGDILQVSSEIAGQLPENYYQRLGDIIFTLLPAGSVTGAPKTKTVDIIRQVEGQPRGYYTGVFGHFDGKDLDSAVMIRFIENRNGKLYFRSGGGITCNSNAESEYQELIDKVYVPIV